MTTILHPVVELSFIAIADPGIANYERIIYRPTQEVNLAEFALTLGVLRDDQSAVPLTDTVFWFSEVTVSPPAWIVVYTGAGERKQYVHSDNTPVYEFHWGRRETVFADARLIPVVLRLSGVLFGRPGIGDAVRRLLADARRAVLQLGVQNRVHELAPPRIGPPGEGRPRADPKLELVALGSEIERELESALTKHYGSGVTSLTLDALVGAGMISPELASALAGFWPIRNQIVHGVKVEEELVQQTIEAGRLILAALKALGASVEPS
jgi:hypothetical protein